MKKLTRLAVAFAIAITISGCSSTNGFSFFSKEKYVAQSARVSDQAQLANLSQLLRANENNPLSNDPTGILLSAKMALDNQKTRTALNQLHNLKNIKLLPAPQQMKYYQLVSIAYLRSNNLAYSTLARISLDDCITDPLSKQANEKLIWNNLLLLPLDQLDNLLKQSNLSETRGWVQLAIITKQNSNNANQISNALLAWQSQFPNHPANTLLPSQSAIAHLPSYSTPSKIALLIPLSGPFGNMGKAVQEGFMAAFYANNTAATTGSISIKVYDSNQGDIVSLYQQAITDGAQFVVGPLTKEHVSQLARQASITVPTLALNALSGNQAPPANFIQFGLLPEQEADQTAEMMWQYGLKNTFLITPAGDWGERLKTSFSTLWLQLGGTIPTSLVVSDQSDFKSEIAQALQVQEIPEKDTPPGKKPKIDIERRQDIDSVFMVSPPALSQQIQPLLRYYYAGNLPFFSTSVIYSGIPNRIKDTDLNGTIFDDMPWTFMPTTYDSLKAQFKSVSPDRFDTYTRLYALGLDSYTIAVMLPRIIALPNIPLQGVTGQLFLGENQLIYRQLLWAQFRKGLPAIWYS